MKKILFKVMTLSVMLLAMPGIFVGCKDYDDDIQVLGNNDEQIKKEFNEKLAQQLAALNAQEAALKQLEADLKAQIAAAQEALKNAADADREKFQADIAAAEARLDAVEDAIKGIQSTQGQIQQQIADMESKYGKKFDELTGLITKLQELVDANDAKQTKALEAAQAALMELISGNTADINTLKGLIGELTTNSATKNELAAAIAALQQDIANNYVTKEALAEMLKKYDDYITSNTEAMAELSGQVEAIDTTLNNLKAEYEKTIPLIQSGIAALEGRLDKIESDFAEHVQKYDELYQAYNDHVAAFTEYQTSVNTQLEALKNFEEATGKKFDEVDTAIGNLQSALADAQTDITNIKGDIEEIQAALAQCATKAELQALDTKLGDLDTKVDGIDTRLSAAESAIQTINADIVKINSALSTLNSKNAKRLTSVTLIPDAYVGGIPSIEFYTAIYHALAAPTDGIYGAASTTATSINSDMTKVCYRLNPTGVSLADIDAANLSFVQQVATSRAAADNVVAIANTESAQPSIADGVLTVYAVKTQDVSVESAGNGRIYTVALRVPIAEKNYFTWTDENGNEVTEDAADAVVYSEYSRLADTEFTPKVAATEEYSQVFEQEPVFHMWSSDIFTSTEAIPTIQVSYNAESFDLSTVATGCMEYAYNGKNIDMLMDDVQLANYGFTVEYSVPSKEYLVNTINQQLYAQVTADGTLTPTMPEGQTGFSRVGKTPIVSAVLKHGNDVVDQRFFKVEYIIDAEATTFPLGNYTHVLSCEPIVWNVTWKQLIDEVITKVGFDMNQEEFAANFTAKTPAEGDGVVAVDLTAVGENDPISWTLDLDQYKNMGGKDAEKKVTIVFENAAGLFPDITIILKGTVTWPTTLPALGKTDSALWSNGVMIVRPIAMPDGWAEGDAVVAYNTPILQGRPAPYLTNLMDCANWDLQFSGINLEGFAVNTEDMPAMTGEGGYQIVNGEAGAVAADDAAAYIDHTEVADFEPFAFTSVDAGADPQIATTVTTLPFIINHNDAGIALVESNTAVINLTWYVALNGTENENFVTLNNTALEIMAPLQEVILGQVEPFFQTTTAQTRDLATGLTIEDAFGTVFNSENLLWKYYNVQDPVFESDPTKMYISDDENGTNPRSLASLNMSATMTPDGSNLTFTGGTAVLRHSVYLNIPVSVQHEWGVLNAVVKVRIDPPKTQN